MKKIIGVLLTLLLITVSGCSRQKQEKKAELPTEANSTDTLQPLMAKSQANFQNIYYGLVFLDKMKIEKGTANMIKISQFLQDKILPQHQIYSRDWKEMCDKQQSISEEIMKHFVAGDYEKTAHSFGQLLGVCVECHKLFRFAKKN